MVPEVIATAGVSGVISNYWGSLLASAVGLMIASGGGIGGGGVLVPIYIILMQLDPKVATPLSNVTIWGGAIANMLLNAKKRHPVAKRPLIDWDLILVMEPATIVGAMLGSYLNRLLPTAVMITLLVTVLGVTSYRTLDKAIKAFKKENKQKKAERESPKEVEMSKMDVPATKAQQEELEAGGDMSVTNPELKALLDRESRTPWARVIFLTIFFLGTVFLTLAKSNFTQCGSTSYWVWTFLMIPFTLVMSSKVRDILLRDYAIKQRLGFQYLEGDVKWDDKTTIRYPLICTLAGLAAGLFGIGGGIVKGPLMLEMGIRPEVAAATSATMILYTTAAASVSFMLFGAVDYDFAIVLFVLGFVFTLVGQLVINHLIKKSGRSSLIVFSIALLIGLSALCMGIQGVMSMFAQSTHDAAKASSNLLCSGGGGGH